MAEYTPTRGMVAALCDHRSATEDDYLRCQRRGLVDLRLMPTEAGRAVIRRQTQRLEDNAASGSGPRARPSGQQRYYRG